MVNSIGNPTKELTAGQIARLLASWHKGMEKSGLSLNDLQRGIEDVKLRKGLIGIWHRESSEPSPEWKRSKTFRNWFMLYPSQVTGRLATWYERMEKLGLTVDDLRRANADVQLRRCLIWYWHIESLTLSPSQKRAKEIMGRNMLEVKEVVECLGLNPDNNQLLALGQVPFSEDILEKCKNTHILVPIFPLSIKNIMDLTRQTFHERTLWHEHYMFEEETGFPEWQLICKTLAPKSLNQTWKKQLAHLGKKEEVPSAIVMVSALISYYLITGERLFENAIGRTSTFGHRGGPAPQLNVGPFPPEGLKVDDFCDWLPNWSFVGNFCAMKKNL